MTALRTRNEATGAVVMWLFSQNYTPDATIDLTWKWLRTRHNGMSKTINAGKFDEAYQDIKNWTDWTYKTFEYREIYPDSVHNKQFCVYHSDMDFIAKHFRGNTKMQKKMFKLIGYYRARMKHEWVYCSYKKWIEIHGDEKRDYKQFQNKLLQIGLLEINNSYRAGSYAKAFKLNIPTDSNYKPIQNDDRNVNNFKDAIVMVCKDGREARNKFGLSRQTAYNYFL